MLTDGLENAFRQGDRARVGHVIFAHGQVGQAGAGRKRLCQEGSAYCMQEYSGMWLRVVHRQCRRTEHACTYRHH